MDRNRYEREPFRITPLIWNENQLREKKLIFSTFIAEERGRTNLRRKSEENLNKDN